MTGEIKLLPCPFCGKQPLSRWWGVSDSADDGGYWDISCCGAFAHEDDEAAAAKVWNKRHSQAGSKPDVQSLLNIADWIEQKGAGGSAKIVREAAAALAEAHYWKTAYALDVQAKASGGARSPPMNNAIEVGAQALANDVWHPPTSLKNLSPSEARKFRRQAEIVLDAVALSRDGLSGAAE